MATNNEREFSTASKYDIYSKLMFIASKYFDVTTEDFLKTGLFGYVTESMAMIARDSSFHKSMLYNESFLNTAIMPKSVYNWARMFGVTIPSATPAYTEMQVTIPLDSLVFQTASSIANASKYGTEVTVSLADKQMMILDRSNQFIASEFRFTLERSVLIYKDAEGSSTITVKYCQTEEPTTILQELQNYFIKSVVTSDNYISFIVRVYQYNIERKEKQIASGSFLDTKVHDFAFSDQFVGARLKYRRAGIESPIELRFSNISLPEGGETRDFAYYNLTDSNNIQIRFSSAAGDFVPASNSTIILDVYTTRGATGNITFTGDVIFRFREELLKNVPVIANFFSESSIGGVDSPSISKLKSTIINEISTRDVIVTETDLNSYFAILTSLLETINDGKVTFVKRRDDILRRVFSAYILMRDGLDINGAPAESNYTSKVIPTNTVTADFAISSNLSRPFGTVIKKKAGTTNEYEYVPSNALDGSEDYYVIPFFMRVNLDPFRKVKYIYNLTDDSTSLSYKDVSGASSEVFFIPSNVSVRRSLEGNNTSPYYIFTFTFVTNINLSQAEGLAQSSFELSFFKRGNESTAIGGTSLNFTVGGEGNRMRVVSVESEDDPNRYATTLEFYVDVPNDGTEFDFSEDEARNNYGTFVRVSHENSELSLPEDVKVQLDLVNLLGSINISFISDKFLLMFRNLDELMFSDILLNKIDPRWNVVPQSKVTASGTEPSSPELGDVWIDTTGSDTDMYVCTNAGEFPASPIITSYEEVVPSGATAEGAVNGYYLYSADAGSTFVVYKYDEKTYVSSVTIRDIPVVHQSFFTSEANQTKFIRQLFVYIDALRENIGKLETNTFFDLKFYNTYGDSQYYETPRTEIDLELDVYVYERTDDLATAIRDYVRLLVDRSNSAGALRVSTLIKELTTNLGRYIDHVDFKGLNGTFTQYVGQVQGVSKSLYAPEYLNIPEENLVNIRVIQLPQ
jgi:hypothetical protein